MSEIPKSDLAVTKFKPFQFSKINKNTDLGQGSSRGNIVEIALHVVGDVDPRNRCGGFTGWEEAPEQHEQRRQRQGREHQECD